MINQESSLLDPAPPKIHHHESILDQPLVMGSVELAPSAVHQVFSVESGSHPPHALFVSSDSSDLEKVSSIPIAQEVSPPTLEMEIEEDSPLALVTLRENHLSFMVPPPSSLVASFDWSQFASCHLPSYVPFEITA